MQKLKKILLELINEFSKIVGYKVNTQKSVALLEVFMEQSEKELIKIILFMKASKRMKQELTRGKKTCKIRLYNLTERN